MDLDQEFSRLWSLVDETCELLATYGIDYWVRWLRSRAETLRAEGAIGAGRFAQGWGGMGGFGDLIIHPLNGHPVAEIDVDAVNRRLDELRAEMYRTAGRIRTDA